MDHYYEFFDRSAFDPIWNLSWVQFLRRYGSSWALNQDYRAGEYTSRSLRELIGFCVDPAPSAEEIENILKHETIRQTVSHSAPQLFMMSCLFSDGLPGMKNRTLYVEATDDVDPLIVAAVDAHLAGRINSATLLAVMKLHCVADLKECVLLSRRDKSALKSVTASKSIWRPIYSWQGEKWLDGEEWANALGVADTRRFIGFVSRAWTENWEVLRLRHNPSDESTQDKPRFRDFRISEQLAVPIMRIVSRLTRPSVFRRWE
jgi:hypothetical protein